MSNHIYHLEGVTKEYGGRCVLHVQDLAIQKGEVLVLVGPSGAGKSTLLRLLNFLESPTSGLVCFLGQEFGASHSPSVSLRRCVTTVFQHPILLNRSVRDNVAYGLHLRGQRDTTSQVQEALEQVGLGDLASRRARTLSGGEAQRVALARAMVLKPEVLLLDEPTANLDPYNVGLIEEIIRTLNDERGTTLIMVTHNVFQARRLGHRAALLLDGQVVEVDDADTFFEAPCDPRTAAFVRGEMVY